ncbi:MAG: hypothetical protein DRP74_04240 [Candidatus Omnitrophota bacterium]|nr:MAG: hypothetical protein DRP74_04240 [Candidatus Omnitrophota bacterium]
MEDVEKTYIAGIVDGEGTVTLMKHYKNETPTPNVTVANNNLKLLLWLKARLGGNIVSKKKYKPHHGDSYVWSIRQDRAIRFLNGIKKFLIIKKPQADLITEKYKSVTHRAGRYTPSLLRKKIQLVAKIRKLNQR